MSSPINTLTNSNSNYAISSTLSPYPDPHPPLSAISLAYIRKCFSLKSSMVKSPLHTAFRVLSIINFTMPIPNTENNNNYNTDNNHSSLNPLIADEYSLSHPYYSYGRTRYQHETPININNEENNNENTNSNDIPSIPSYCQRLDSIDHRISIPIPNNSTNTNQQNYYSSPVYYVTGSNVEVCSTGSGLCSERAGLSLIRQLNYNEIHEIYIVSDLLNNPLEPGLLCREFLLQFIHTKIPIYLASKKINTNSNTTTNTTDDDEYEFTYRVVYLHDLYPYPPLYTQISAPFISEWAKKFNSTREYILEYNNNNNNNGISSNLLLFNEISILLNNNPRKLYELYQLTHEYIQYDHRNWINSIQLSSIIYFSDHSYYCSHQTKLAEFGYSLDPITKSIDEIERKYRNSIWPILILQMDQYGILHSPCAPARAHITELGMGKCKILIHQSNGKLLLISFNELVPGTVNEDLQSALIQQQQKF